MFVVPDTDEPAQFGDIFAAEWLYPTWTEDDAQQLGRFNAKGGNVAYGGHAATTDQDFLLSHTVRPLGLVSVDDDCHWETVTTRYQEGFLHFAPLVSPVPEDYSGNKFSRFFMGDAPNLGQVSVDLRRSSRIRVRNEAKIAQLLATRVLRVTDELLDQLAARWGAHSVRRGPAVALTSGNKLLRCLEHAAGSATSADLATSDSIARILSASWDAEGAVIDLVDTADEQRLKVGTLPPGTTGEIRRHLEQLHRHTEEALAALASSTDF